MNLSIQELRQSPHLSASSINSYMDCGLSYKFSRVDGIPPEFTADALLFGSCIHKALEEFNNAKRNKHQKSPEELQARFASAWNESVRENESIQFKKGESADSLLEKGMTMLAAYYAQNPPNQYKVMGAEIPFSFTMEGLPVPVIGVMDLVEEDEGGNLIITDFKTTSRSFSRKEIDESLQLTVYSMAVKEFGFSHQEILLKFDCLIKTRTPKFEQYYTIRTEADEQRARKKILRVWDGIQKKVFIPNDSSWKCAGCAYKKHCDSWFEREEAI